MEIEYEVVTDDFVEFFQTDAHLHQREHPYRTPYLFTSFILVIMILLYARIVTSAGIIGPFVFCTPMLVASIVFFILYPSILKKTLKRSVESIYVSSHEIGTHKLKITETWVIDKTSTSELDMQWIAVEKIVETDRHIFIYTNPMKAFLIPKRAFPDEAKCREFIETAKKFHADAAREK